MPELIATIPTDDFDNFYSYKSGNGCVRMVRLSDLPAEAMEVEAFMRDMKAKATEFMEFPCKCNAMIPFEEGIIFRFEKEEASDDEDGN